MLSLEQRVKWAEREDRAKDPIEFLVENYPDGVTRTQLSESDSGLYRIISRRGQLDQAIPYFDEKASRKASVNFRKARLNRSRFGHDPLKYYHDNYENVSREQLGTIDLALRDRLRRDGLLNRIPDNTEVFGGDPEKYYRDNHYGLTRPQLEKENKILYDRLVRGKTIDIVPADFGDDSALYYSTYYQGVTRGELFVKNRRLYNRMRRDGSLSDVPKAKTRSPIKQLFGNDPVGYYLKHYKGMTRWELQQKNSSLYQKLWRDGKLDIVPTVGLAFGGDALGYYKKHFDGVPRGELYTKHQYLYFKLLKEGTIKHVPTLQSLKMQPPQ